MNSRQYLGVFVATIIFAFTGAYLGSRSTPLMASADPAVGNGSSQATTGSSQTGSDPGGGICQSSGAFSLCNPITGTVTLSNASPLVLSNTTGPTIIASSATTGTVFQMKPTGSGTGDLFDVMDKTGATICINVTNGGSLTVSANCGGVLSAKTVTANPHFSQNSACSGATPQTGQSVCTITASSSSAVFTFSANYTGTAHPSCVALDETTVTSAVKIAYAGSSGAWTSATATTPGASDVVDFICIANSGN